MAIVDRPEPSWFSAPSCVLSKTAPSDVSITVAGRLDPVPDSDLTEVGRLLGRASSALMLHSQSDAHRTRRRFRQGVALSDVPPPIVHTPTERRAISRALAMARPRDYLLVLADKPLPVVA